jgi:hypothetical protein
MAEELPGGGNVLSGFDSCGIGIGGADSMGASFGGLIGVW